MCSTVPSRMLVMCEAFWTLMQSGSQCYQVRLSQALCPSHLCLPHLWTLPAEHQDLLHEHCDMSITNTYNQLGRYHGQLSTDSSELANTILKVRNHTSDRVMTYFSHFVLLAVHDNFATQATESQQYISWVIFTIKYMHQFHSSIQNSNRSLTVLLLLFSPVSLGLLLLAPSVQCLQIRLYLLNPTMSKDSLPFENMWVSLTERRAVS